MTAICPRKHKIEEPLLPPVSKRQKTVTEQHLGGEQIVAPLISQPDIRFLDRNRKRVHPEDNSLLEQELSRSKRQCTKQPTVDKCNIAQPLVDFKDKEMDDPSFNDYNYWMLPLPSLEECKDIL